MWSRTLEDLYGFGKTGWTDEAREASLAARQGAAKEKLDAAQKEFFKDTSNHEKGVAYAKARDEHESVKGEVAAYNKYKAEKNMSSGQRLAAMDAKYNETAKNYQTTVHSTINTTHLTHEQADRTQGRVDKDAKILEKVALGK